MRVFRTFSTRISLYVILLTAALFLTASVTAYKINYDSVRKEAVTNAFSQLRALNLEMENVLRPVASVINNLVSRAELMVLSDRDTSDFLRLIEDVLKNSPQLKDIAIALEPYYYRHQKQFTAYSINEGDSIKSMMITDPLYTYPYYDWYVIPKCTDSTYWTDPYIDKVWDNLSLCSYTAPLHDRSGSTTIPTTSSSARPPDTSYTPTTALSSTRRFSPTPSRPATRPSPRPAGE